MKRITAILFVLLISSAASLSAAVKITITAPQVSATTPNALDINNALADPATVSVFETKLNNSDLSKLGSQELLANAFGNSAVYASQSASLAGYQGYDLFAIMVGGSASIQLPTYSLSPDTIDKIQDDIIKDKDIDAGVGFSSAFNLGLNITPVKNMIGLGALLSNRMYVNIKYFSLSQDIGDFSLESSTFGFGINYQIIDRGGDRFSFFKWSGLSIGTGYLHTTSKVDMKLKFDEYVSNGINAGAAGTIYMGFKPETNFGIDITNSIIPIDIATSLRLLWIFNITLGAGVDITSGESKVVAKSTSSMKIYNSSMSEVSTTGGTPGSATIDASTTDKPTFANYRLTGGLGVCLWVIPVDVQLTTYPMTKGFAVNVSTGVVW